MYRIGIDCGSTTLKLVVIDKDNKIVHSKYERHKADIAATLVQLLEECEKKFPGMEAPITFTGSAGFKIAEKLGAEHIQEVIAATKAIKTNYDDIDICIELGGEDAKLIFFDGPNPEQRMNGACAGGTGAFVDQMATLLNTDANGVNEYAKGYDKLYPIAGRCGVFAKTDVQPLLNQGVKKENIAASIFQAIVNQTIAGLAQGKSMKGKVIFLGGPLTFMSELRKRFIETLELDEKETVLPEQSSVFMAYGSALFAYGKTLKVKDLIKGMKNDGKKEAMDYKKIMPKLFKDDKEFKEFVDRHAEAKVESIDLKKYKGKAYLGIDCGSTTTKMILLSEDYKILYQYYNSNKGQPVDVVKEQLLHIYKILPKDVVIAGAVSTGYGEKLVESAFKLDKGQVETICHFKAAKHFMPNVDFIIDIGGQDMKCFKITNNNISSIILNEACSSGCGSFIETFATNLGYDVKDFAKVGLEATTPVDLGSKCTVFMNSSVKSAQKEGAQPSDISAGLAYSVVKNALFKVIRVNDVLEECGENIVVQGGTFYNNAVLRAFELETGVNVIRPNIAGLMGAFGAALVAKELGNEKSTMMDAKTMASFEYDSRNLNCGACPNNCLMTLNTFTDGSKHISGNRCEIGAGIKRDVSLPNMYQWKYDRLWQYETAPTMKDKKGTIGIPFVLNMFENIPFWSVFFEELGYGIKLSARSNKKVYEKGQQSIPSDTACYPAKIVHGHIEVLKERDDIDFIFYPNLPFNFREKDYASNHYNCPVVAHYPELIQNNVDDLENFLQPHLALADVAKSGPIKQMNAKFVKNIIETLKPYMKLSKKDVEKAYEKAIEAYKGYKEEVREQAEIAYSFAKANDKKIIVLAGRPYHIDPEINHGIDRLLTSLDCVVISEDGVSHLADVTDKNVLNQWTYHTRLYDAAKWVTQHSSANLVQLVSFGCGLDAITTDEVNDILVKHNKFYTQLKIDEISNLGAVTIRIRSLLENL